MNRLLIILLLVAFNCKPKTNNLAVETINKVDSSKTLLIPIDKKFKNIVDSLPTISTPITFDSEDGIPYGQFAIQDDQFLLTIKKRIPELLGYGKIDESTNYYLIIGISPSDIGSPILMTFDKTGNKIDSYFMFKTAGGDIGYYSRNTATLEDNKEFTVTDSTTTRDLNETGDEEIEGTDKLTVTRTKYRILDTGKIEEVRD